MSLLGIIGQLQSIQPTRRDATAQTLALDLTKARNSILMMARLLQNSGRTQSNQYVPNQASSTKRADTLTKEVRKTSGNLERLSGDQKRFKAFVQQTVNNIDKQLRSFRSLTKRNENMLRSVQSEIGLGRPQRAINYAFGTSAAQVPSYGRNIKSQLNRLSQQISVLNSNQQRMIREGEREAEDRSRRDMGIIGGRPGTGGAMRFTQKLGMLNAMARKNLSETQLPGITQPGRPDITQARLNSLYGGLALYLIANVKGEGLLEMMVGKETADFLKSLGRGDWKGKIEALKEGTPYKLDGSVRLKGGKAESDAVKEINSKIDELKQKMSVAEIDTKTKDELLKQIQELEKQRLQSLKEGGIITQEHVKAGLAKPEEVSYYENRSTAEIAGRYIPKEVVVQYPEIWKYDATTGSAMLKEDWKTSAEKMGNITAISTKPSTSAKNFNVQEVKSDTEFMEKVEKVSKKFNIDPADLLAVMMRESGLDPSIKNPAKDSTASGLIQFTEDTAKTLGTTTAALRQMTRSQQMDYVEKYFDYWNLPKGADRGTIYSYLYVPARAQRGEAVLARRGEKYYDKNYQLDVVEPFGVIDKADLAAETAKFKDIVSKILEQTPPVASTRRQTAEMTAAATENAVKTVEDNSAETQALIAQQTEIREQKVDQDIVNTQGVALAADMKVNKLYRVVEKNTKEINSVREYVRVATGASDFSVRNPILDKSWNV